MTPINIAATVNLLGYTMGIALYAMLLVMVVRRSPYPARASASTHPSASTTWPANNLLFTTAILGLLWNVGAFATYGARDFGAAQPSPLLIAVAFSALEFLPAVVVHSALRTSERGAEHWEARWIIVAAYCLSAAACSMNVYDAVLMKAGPSLLALRGLTVGYVALIVTLFMSTRRQPGWKRAVWASALAVFAVSALHLSQHYEGSADSWFRELTGHHASLPLALAILYQDYRFAFADIFLKRALALLMLVTLAFGLYLTVAAPFLAMHDVPDQMHARAVGVLLGLWVLTALLYPWLRCAVGRFVDKVVLRRADYGELRNKVARLLAAHESSTMILEEICRVLAPSLSAGTVRWMRADAPAISSDEEISSVTGQGDAAPDAPSQGNSASRAAHMAARISDSPNDRNVTLLERSSGASALVFVPTAEPPYYALEVGALAGGRRLLSDDMTMLESVALMTARRIDGLRVTHERCEQSLREQEISKLATEAQLRALRAQINPHFLFNALTTIGYLVQTAPERALETLMKLTSLLRGALRSTDEFVTLGEELKLIASYLDIERARFEERLRVNVDVPPRLLMIRLPSLLVQPLVENAIKHGIAPSRYGGEVSISAHLEPAADHGPPGSGEILCITVSDTGVGASEVELAHGRRRGLGLNNVEQRLHCYYGPTASLRIESVSGEGATVELRMPITTSGQSQFETVGTGSLATEQRKGA